MPPGRDLGAPFGRFLDHLPVGRRFGLDVNGVDDAVVEALLGAVAGSGERPGIVLVPVGGVFGEWKGPGATAARLPLDDARKILSALAGSVAGPFQPARRSALARQVVAALGDAAQRLDGECADLSLFLGRNLSELAPRLLSRNELAAAEKRGLLFSGDHDGFAAALGATLSDGGVVIDDSGVISLLFGGGARPCDPAACLRVLSPSATDRRRGRPKD